MKDFTLCGIVIGFLVILGLGVCEQIYLGNFTNELVNDVGKVEKLVYSGYITESVDILQNIINTWEKRKKSLNMMMNHQDINKISESLIEINSKLKHFSNSDNISANFALLKEYILNIEEENKFTIGNVL